jgi:hypothetical protein
MTTIFPPIEIIDVIEIDENGEFYLSDDATGEQRKIFDRFIADIGEDMRNGAALVED